MIKTKVDLLQAIREDAAIIKKRVYEGELQKQAAELVAKAEKASSKMTKEELLALYDSVNSFSWYAPHK